MNIYLFFSVFPFNILLLFSNAQQQKDYLFPGETKFATNNRYYVPFEQKFLESNQSRFEIELIREVQIENQHSINLTEQMKLFYFQQLNEEEDNMIMTMDNQHLYCLYVIKNYLLNQQLVIHPHFCNITLPYQSCSQLIQLNDSSIISIFNLEGKVFDQLQLQFEQNCNIDLAYGHQIIFIFEQNCQSTNVYQVEIDEEQFQYKSVKKLDLFEGINITTLKIEYILKIELCDLERIFFIFQDFVLQYNFRRNNLFQFLKFVNITMLKVFQLCSTSCLVLDIENSSQQMRLKEDLLNISASSYKNALLNEKILVLFFEHYILAKINDQLQYHINITLPEMLPLIGLSYFIGVHQSKLKLFQIQSPRNYNQFYLSQKILYLILASNPYYNSFYLEQGEIEIVKENESKLISKQYEQMVYLNDDMLDICLEQKLLSETLPINLVAIQDNETYYQINERISIDTCNFSFPKYIKIMHFGQLNDQIKMLVIFKQEDILTFVFCYNGQIISEQNMKLIKQVLNILVINQRNILICYEKLISLVIIDDSLSIKTTSYPQEHRIININRQYVYISILYEGCRFSLAHIVSDRLVGLEQFQNYPFPKSLNCTFNYKTSKSQFIISQDEIIILSNVNMRYKLKGKIVKVLIEILSDNFVLVIEEENEIRLEFYRVLRTEIVLQYIIPKYDFKFQPTATQKYENQYLMLSAKHQSKSYLLIYNLRNPAINALIYITEIDESLQFFQFYENAKRTVVYLYQGKLYLYLLDKCCIRYTFQQRNALIMRKKIQILVNSLVNNQSDTINIQISKFNNDYILSAMNNAQQLSFLNKPLNQDLFIGNIIRVDVQQKDDFVITSPMNITSEHLPCDYFESNVCFLQGDLINIQTLKVLQNNSFDIGEIIIKRINFDEDSHTYQILFYNIMRPDLYIQQLEQPKDDLNQSVLIRKTKRYSILPKSDVEQLEKVKIIQHIYYFQLMGAKSLLYYKDICQILMNSSQSSYIIMYFADCTYLSNSTYICIFFEDLKINIKIFAVNDKKIYQDQFCYADIIQAHEISLSNIFNQIEIYYFQLNMKKIEIISVAKDGFTYVLQFLMFQCTNFSLLLEISFNTVQYDHMRIKSYLFLRYEKNAEMLKMLYADEYFVVASYQLDGKEIVSVYDIRGDMKNKDYLDSIQRLQSFDYQRIEKFNASHYVIYSHMKKRLYFLTLNQLKVECLGQCTENANLILSNEVSTLTLEISLENQLGQKYLTIKSAMILNNFLLILIFLKFGKRAK
ncbi:unnamed protein product (macronuclear) [Paramecium tetraurelia]|uniref:Transmembrane protein n=1 Tax=Paramecium tetraurelia TaxID=5888 RepID=A0C186_PARTE|nr:uncharacterized protein GSPATT00034029001 [Paramecium tetraurelia]CAK64553.1 unnamed protein product [Paramecium tetraurelia]|eukprot:XP_001431951.1 hypothetical protein (macronuclear) [Paramecium tetraurelia strain d4-2]